ncbi:NmrA-like family protein [Thalassoglobus neptunius]|uniref:NmrA-like family protein n=2 Tax=Thalassoglobus neptunius TaxID=1938619 RepID=A0A5C5X3E5_9PLAN|nr:NmrA-like family protein [Thalassoglobus neptunius]
MKVLVLGGTGATGKQLLDQLLDRGHEVHAVVRSTTSLTDELIKNDNLSLTEASVLDLDQSKLQELVSGCDAVASCLGHNLSLRGIFGPPYRLVTEAARRVCSVVQNSKSSRPLKFVLMNTTGNRNRDLNEPVSFAQRCIVGLLRYLVPPHADNEDAAEYLRSTIGQSNDQIEWVVVRPDSLINESSVSPYSLHASPTRSAIFDAGKTSRINVANFIAALIDTDDLWQTWKGKMPVIYNSTTSSPDAPESPQS